MSKEITVEVDFGSAADGVEIASKIRFNITKEKAKHLLKILDSELLQVGDILNVPLDGIEALDDEGAEMELEWRPASVIATLYGSSDSLDNLFLSVGSRDCDGEYMVGYLPLSHDEIVAIATEGGDDEGTFRVWVETTIIRDDSVITGKPSEIEANVENANHALHNLYDAGEVECESVVCMKRLSAAEVTELNGRAA